MNSLRARIAALLIAAIIAVVALATFAAWTALTPPQPAATIGPTAAELQLLARLAESEPAAAARVGLVVAEVPAPVEPLERMTELLEHALAHNGPPRAAQVGRVEGVAALIASVQLQDNRWLIARIPDLTPPSGRWVVLVLWSGLIVLGAGAVALYGAWLVTRPLQLLREVATHVGADGEIAPVPETGAAELRATAELINRLSAQLKSAMESRMRLVAAAGHDLRTPMTRMRLRAEFIPEDAERAKWLADLEELDMIADSAIRLVREEVSPGTTEPLRLDLMLREMVADLAPLGHPLQLAPDLPALQVRAGPQALKRALRNLAINAATHGGGGEITLAAEGTQAVVEIRDRGPGIPEAVLGQVFEPFFRVDPARRKVLPGAGLGLAIAREIVERFGGTIALRNRAGGGLEQRVSLPRA